MLEGKGARVAFVTTRGFEDTISIGRQARPRLYDWFQPPPPCLVPAALRFGVEERVSAEGERLIAPDPEELRRLVEQIRASGAEAVAISLLFSFANPENEREVAGALSSLGLPLSISHRILPEFREYERASTVVANAYLAPKVGGYLAGLAASVECNSIDLTHTSHCPVLTGVQRVSQEVFRHLAAMNSATEAIIYDRYAKCWRSPDAIERLRLSTSNLPQSRNQTRQTGPSPSSGAVVSAW